MAPRAILAVEESHSLTSAVAEENKAKRSAYPAAPLLEAAHTRAELRDDQEGSRLGGFVLSSRHREWTGYEGRAAFGEYLVKQPMCFEVDKVSLRSVRSAVECDARAIR